MPKLTLLRPYTVDDILKEFKRFQTIIMCADLSPEHRYRAASTMEAAFVMLNIMFDREPPKRTGNYSG